MLICIMLQPERLILASLLIQNSDLFSIVSETYQCSIYFYIFKWIFNHDIILLIPLNVFCNKVSCADHVFIGHTWLWLLGIIITLRKQYFSSLAYIRTVQDFISLCQNSPGTAWASAGSPMVSRRILLGTCPARVSSLLGGEPRSLPPPSVFQRDHCSFVHLPASHTPGISLFSKLIAIFPGTIGSNS